MMMMFNNRCTPYSVLWLLLSPSRRQDDERGRGFLGGIADKASTGGLIEEDRGLVFAERRRERERSAKSRSGGAITQNQVNPPVRRLPLPSHPCPAVRIRALLQLCSERLSFRV